MRKKSPIAVFVALVFIMALTSPALAADAAVPYSFQTKDFTKKTPHGDPRKAIADGLSQPAKPGQPMPTVRPIVPSGKPQAPAQPPRPYVKNPGPSPQDSKKNATFVNKVSTAPGPIPANNKTPITGYDRTARDLGR